MESSMSTRENGMPSTALVRSRSEKEKKLGHRRVGMGGEVTYKKIQTSQIMGSIQLSIQHAVGGLASKPERDLLMQDFMTVETTTFPPGGTNLTPAHHYSEFVFKTYAPIAFRYFRDLFGIQTEDFLMSFCSVPLRELSNPGASGSIFYLTEDDEFIMKTVQHKEGQFLQKLLPGYYLNLNQNPRTLLPKFFGLYCYHCNSKNIRIVAMNNLLPSSITIHQKYDLKGSTFKRKASESEIQKNSPTFKDLDFIEHHPEGLFLEGDTYNALIKTIQRDCRVLESFQIMDYSLLVGVHNLDQAARERAEISAEGQSSVDGLDSGAGDLTSSGIKRSKSLNRQRLVAHSTAMESIQAKSKPGDDEDDVPAGGIPARNMKRERLLLFIGIIDILQSYRFKKKLEHAWKALLYDGDTISVHRPGFYSERFQHFMANTVFKKIPSSLKHTLTRRKTTLKIKPPNSDENNKAIITHPANHSIPPAVQEDSNRDSSGGDKNVVNINKPASHTTTRCSIEKADCSLSHQDSVSVSDVKLEEWTESKISLNVESNSSTSGIESLFTSTSRHIVWASVEGSTPTWSEGTPSFTDSSYSADVSCQTTPAHNNIYKKTDDIALVP